MFENFHNKNFAFVFSISAEEGSMLDLVNLFAERLIIMAGAVSFPLIIRTKSLSWGSKNKTVVFFCCEKHCFLNKGERESEGEKERERLLSVPVRLM